MAKWKVNEGTQVAWGEKMYAGGDTFSATEAEITAEGMGAYVTPVRESAAKKPEAAKPAVKETEKAVSQAASPADNKAVAAPAPREPMPTFDIRSAPKPGK